MDVLCIVAFSSAVHINIIGCVPHAILIIIIIKYLLFVCSALTQMHAFYVPSYAPEIELTVWRLLLLLLTRSTGLTFIQ